MNVCVLEYPEDGDQAEVYLLDYDALSQDSCSDCQEYAEGIDEALARKDNLASVPMRLDLENVHKYQVKVPCQIDRVITLYLV